MGRVSVGGYRLLLGDPSGATIVPTCEARESSALAQALAQADGERKPPPNVADRLEGAVEDASQVTRKVSNSSGLIEGTKTPTATTGTTKTKTNTVKTTSTQTTTGKTSTDKTPGVKTSVPTIGSAASTAFVEGSEGDFTVAATGSPTPTFTESGELPDGVTFNGSALTGTPSASGAFTIVFTATNSAGSSHQTFTLTVNSQPAITSAEATTFTYRQPGSFTVTVTGAPTPTIAEAGTLPPGVTFSKGVLSGTPEKVGLYRIAFTATNGVGSDAVQSDFTLTVER